MDITARITLKVLSIMAAFAGVVLLAYTARTQLLWIAIAAFLAVALNPVVERLRRVAPKRSRVSAVAGVFLMAVAVFGFMLATLAPPLVHQTRELVTHAPDYARELVSGPSFVSQQIRNYHLVDRVQDGQNQIVGYVSSAGGSFLSLATGFFSSFVAGITVTALTFFMLLEGPRWVGSFWTLVPTKQRGHAQELAQKMYETVTGYVTGNLFTSLIAGSLTAIVLAVTGVPYAIALGIVVAILDFIPLVGATLAAVLVTFVALFTSPVAAVIVLVFFVIYQQIENHVLQPLVYGRTVRMSPLLVLASVLIGAGVGGILGAMVAIPVGASTQILIRDVVERRSARGR